MLAGCGGGEPGPHASGPVATVPPPSTERPLEAGSAGRRAPATVIAAGDIGTCESDSDEATAALVGRVRGTVLTLGDTVYPNGAAGELEECYDPTWGRFRDRTYPVPGNHDYYSDDAAPYFSYFGARAGTRGKGWYSFELAGWRLIALNSNCDAVGCDEDSEQVNWLREELRRHPARCTLAYFHHPRFSSGSEHGSNDELQPIWATLATGGADVVLSAHEHSYERLALLDAEGAPDPARGVRAFVIGTGGADFYGFDEPVTGSEVRNDDTHGVLVLNLRDGSYDWRFVPAGDGGFTDAGSG